MARRRKRIEREAPSPPPAPPEPTGFPSIAPRLAKLVPRLASEHDGEVVATVHAIGRTLAGAGLDWHDLAKALSGDLAPPRWHLIGIADQQGWLAALAHSYPLSDWERAFVTGIRDKLTKAQIRREDASCSERQVSVLERLIVAAWLEGLRPTG